MSDKIFGENDGDMVEVYPVWNDEYLKNIRIDENYLKGIILQSRGKLKGNYYIITPETCTVLGDTTMKNSTGNDVHFKMRASLLSSKMSKRVHDNHQMILLLVIPVDKKGELYL